MNAARLLTALVRAAARRAWLTVAVAVALGGAATALALGLSPTAATSTLVGRSSDTYKATQRFYQHFGDEAVVVVVRGPVRSWTLTSDLERELTMEGCIAGALGPEGLAHHGGPRGPCGQLSATRPVKVVFGPGTFINEATIQVAGGLQGQLQGARQQAGAACQSVLQAARQRHLSRARGQQLCQEAASLVMLNFERQLVQAAVHYGLNINQLAGGIAINNPDWVSKLIFDPLRPVGTPKQRFAYLFPNANTAIVTVRLKPGLSEPAKTHVIGLIRKAVAMPDWAPEHGETYLVTGEPVIVSDLTGSITDSVKLLLIAVLVVMAASLVLVFSGRPRLLPLAIALLAAALTFGALALSGASLTMASIGVLPVLIGLTVDYAIQFQSRVEEAERGRIGGDQGGGHPAAMRRAVAVGGPTIATACAATAGGFLVLLLSPVPMVRGFGVLLVAGIGLAFVCTFTVGAAVLTLGRRREQSQTARPRGWRAPRRLLDAWRSAQDTLAAAVRGARELVLENQALRRAGRWTMSQSTGRPSRVLAVGFALAALGWGLDTQTRVQADVQKLVPQNLDSLRNLNTLERDTGVGGELDVMVSADDLTKADVVHWMTSYQRTVLQHFGYSLTTARRGCGHVQLCPAFSLPDLFSYASPGGTGANATPSQADVRGFLAAVPGYFSQGVITPDHRTATLAFGIRFMPLDQQERVIQAVRSRLHPPPGVHAELVGLPVLASEADAAISPAWRRVVTLLAGLAAVALVLLAAFRGDWRRALIPLVPIALATGWSALVLFAIRVPLNPMSVTLGALVIAISTEFSVLLAERYRQERRAGRDPMGALQHTYANTGAAVLASGVTAIAGFAVLVLSDINMLRGFGFVTVVDLTVSLLGVLIVLPSTLLLAESGSLMRAALLHPPRGVPLRRRIGGRARHETA